MRIRIVESKRVICLNWLGPLRPISEQAAKFDRQLWQTGWWWLLPRDLNCLSNPSQDRHLTGVIITTRAFEHLRRRAYAAAAG